MLARVLARVRTSVLARVPIFTLAVFAKYFFFVVVVVVVVVATLGRVPISPAVVCAQHERSAPSILKAGSLYAEQRGNRRKGSTELSASFGSGDTNPSAADSHSRTYGAGSPVPSAAPSSTTAGRAAARTAASPRSAR